MTYYVCLTAPAGNYQCNTYLVKIYLSLLLTTKSETDNSVNYLDITITKVNDKHSLKLYRKPILTNHTIHASLNHPCSH